VPGIVNVAKMFTRTQATSGLPGRSIPLLALTLPGVFSIILISTSHLHILGSKREYIQHHKTTVSVLVQLLSATMGILQVTTLTSVISASFRLQLSKQPMQLDVISLLNAIIVPRIPWGLSLQMIFLATIMVVLAQGPGALWAGALTPVSTSTVALLGRVAVPIYTHDTEPFWNSEFKFRPEEKNHVWNYVQNCTSRRDNMLSATSVSNCPAPNYQAQLLGSARDASAEGGITVRNHSKVDSPAWTYRGRSYGVGAAQGLSPLQRLAAGHELLNYTYNETGYQTTVECRRNHSSALNFTDSNTVDSVMVWWVKGLLPNSISPEVYPVVAWKRDSLEESAVLAWVGVSHDDTHMIGIVASERYGNFNNIQCAITFKPALFAVSVNTTGQTIHVSPVDGPQAASDIDRTGRLRSNAIWSLNLLSRMSTSLYVSVLGEALSNNLLTVSSLSGGGAAEDDALRSTGESFTAMLDDILGIYGGSQLVLPEGSAGQDLTDIRGEFAAMRVGQPRYQCAVLVINVALLLLILAEGLRTRWWQELPSFDTLDFESIVNAAFATGPWVLQRVGSEERRSVVIETIKDELDGDSCETSADNSPHEIVPGFEDEVVVTSLTETSLLEHANQQGGNSRGTDYA
jgi:hypothetical protein